MRPATLPPALKVGQEVVLVEGGPWQKVLRVTPCAAYVQEAYAEPKLVELPSGRTFLARSGGAIVPVSVHSFVYGRR